jgi:anti-sigma factor RsiW
MTHRDAWELLDEFLDGALGAEARWQVATHLAECPICQTKVAAQARLRGVVRERLMAVEPPPGLSMRLTAALTAEAVAPTHGVQPRWPALPVGVVAFVGPALAVLWLMIAIAIPAARAEGDLTRELVATHALFAHDESLFDVAGDGSVVSAWFRDAAGLQVTTPPLDGYTLVGGRLMAIDGHPAAQIVYEGKPEGVYVSLLQFQHNTPNLIPLPGGHDVTFDQQGPMSLATWVSGDERVALIGAVPSDELRRLASDLAGRSESAPAAKA